MENWKHDLINKEGQFISDVTLKIAGEERQITTITSIPKNSKKRINMQVWDLSEELIQRKCIKSEKDAIIVMKIKREANRLGLWHAKPTKIANEIGATKVKVSQTISKCMKIDMIKRIDRGLYEINPYYFKPKGATDEECRELQNIWREKHYEPTSADIERLIKEVN